MTASKAFGNVAKLKQLGTPVTVYGVKGDGVTDDTAAIQQCLNDNRVVYFPTPAVAYLITSLDIPANTIINTENINVRFKQASGTNAELRMLYVRGSNVEIGDLTGEGNIATDTDEFKHVLAILTRSPSSSNVRQGADVAIDNVRLGHIRGLNIRGDVVSIGQNANRPITNVYVESAHGDNILRNVVSVVGGDNIYVGRVTGTQVGYMAADIEPDGDYTGLASNIHF